jgi:uncharacterized protein YijF (DUF1287 family)
MVTTTASTLGSPVNARAAAARPGLLARVGRRTRGLAWPCALAAAAWASLTGAAPGQAQSAAAPEPALGVADTGIFSDLDAQVQIDLNIEADAPGAIELIVIDDGRGARGRRRDRALLVLYVDDWPTKVYPLDGAARVTVGEHELALRPGDQRELAPLLPRARIRVLPPGASPRPGDRDHDGIPDPLDILIGAKKTALNRDAYGAGYIVIDYPMGDVPRNVGVCTDVVIRALRNAGLDLQEVVHRDIRKAPASYPMVDSPNTHIDHRRVRTLLPYFRRHWEQHSAALADPADPVRPGDVIFLDTMPGRSGPDHVGIVSDRAGPSGYPLIVNNWTNGTFTTEMDLFGWVPVTHRFRIRPP